jgi:Na+/melibiose symporter-like transporter
MSFRRLRPQPHLFEGQQRRRAYSHGDLSYLPLLTPSFPTEEKVLSLREKVLYTLPWLPFTFSQGIFNVWSYNFYSNVLDLNTMNVGWMVTVAVFLLQVPFAAYIQDNWISRFGRRRQYMIFLAPLYFLSLFAMFYIPTFPNHWLGFSGTTILAVYFTVTMTLVVN